MTEAALAATLVVTGVATYYPAAQFDGRPLYCDQFTKRDLIYSENTEPWAAFDVNWYRSGRVRCGDLIALQFEGGKRLTVRAWDAGMFQGYYVEGWPELEIVADLPEHLRPDKAMSWRARVMNLSRLAEKAGMR